MAYRWQCFGRSSRSGHSCAKQPPGRTHSDPAKRRPFLSKPGFVELFEHRKACPLLSGPPLLSRPPSPAPVDPKAGIKTKPGSSTATGSTLSISVASDLVAGIQQPCHHGGQQGLQHQRSNVERHLDTQTARSASAKTRDDRRLTISPGEVQALAAPVTLACHGPKHQFSDKCHH